MDSQIWLKDELLGNFKAVPKFQDCDCEFSTLHLIRTMDFPKMWGGYNHQVEFSYLSQKPSHQTSVKMSPIKVRHC